MSVKDEEIDLVYLWVDGNDPKWRARHDAAVGTTKESSATNCDGRYADNEELKYSLRAVEKYAPWIRMIYIVTDSQIPKWLDTSNSKVRIVDHREILPESVLPTFNSRTIEHALYRIPGLSERFLYANDDTFFNREVSPSDFFTEEGWPVIRFNRRPLRKLTLWFKENIMGRKISNYNMAVQNSARLVQARFGRYIGHKTHHNIDAYNKSQYRHAFETFKDVIEPTLAHKERSADDYNRNLYSYLPVVEKKCRVRFVTRDESFRLHIHIPHHYDELERKKPLLFCLNDSEYAGAEDRRKVKEYLERRFPEKSGFEK